MREPGVVVVLIIGMSLTTYVMKAGGFWLTGRFDHSPRTAAALRTLPGAIVVSLLVPELSGFGIPGWIAAAAVGVAAVRTDSVLFPLSFGVGAVVTLRHLL